MSEQPVQAVAAATVVPVRDADDGIEVLLLRRDTGLRSFAGLWVFPGGRIDRDDRGADEEESARITAVREAHEEAGLDLAPGDLRAWSHWTPPPNRSRRFATWFFLAPVSADVEITVDAGEVHEHRWLTPAAALAARDRGEIELAPPTVVTLHQLRGARSVAELTGPGARPRPVERFASQHALDADPPALLWHGDAGYLDGDPTRPGARHRLVMGETWHYQRELASRAPEGQAVDVTSALDPVRALTAFDAEPVDPTADLQAIAAQMTAINRGALLVRRTDGRIGILTERDLVHGVADGAPGTWATDIMTREVRVVEADTTVASAAEQMLAAGIRHLVVRDGDRLGILSLRDCVAPLLALVDTGA